MAKNLYIVATPIGNLGDISDRSKEILTKVDKIYAEDTRVASKILDYLDINSNLESFHAHSSSNIFDKVLKDVVEGDVALITDAGTPGISDPGNELIDYLLEKDDSINIIPIPGPSAVTAALSVCGFDVKRFTFLGFLPKKKINKTLKHVSESEIAFIYFDSPHRVLKNLNKLSEMLDGTRRVFVARELTKLHETHYRGEIIDVLAQLKDETNLKGEFVVVVEKG